MNLPTPIQAFKDNYIWTWHDVDASRIWVVDPGDAEPILNYLAQYHFTLAGILLTHHHADHSGGIQKLLATMPNIPVYASTHSSVDNISHRVKQHNEIQCGPYIFRVLEIPGHTLDHVAYYNEEILFCGDTLFSAGCGRVFEGTYAQMYDSLIQLKSLPGTVKIYCGHEYTLANLKFATAVEPDNLFIQERIVFAEQQISFNQPTLPSSMEQEKKINPFLRCEEPKVIEAAERYAGEKLLNASSVFETLRKWKNVYS